MVGGWVRRLGTRTGLQIVAALLLFGSGLVIGGAATFMAVRDRLTVGPSLPPIGRGDPNRFASFLLRDWQPKYQLTDEQVARIRGLLLSQFEKLQEIFQEGQRKSQALERPWLAEMKKVMTAEQYRRWKQDYDDRKMRRMQRGPGRRGRRGDGGPDGSRRWSDRPGERRFDPNRPGRRSETPPGSERPERGAPVPPPPVPAEPGPGALPPRP